MHCWCILLVGLWVFEFTLMLASAIACFTMVTDIQGVIDCPM